MADAVPAGANAEQHRAAWLWLDALALPATPDRVEALAPYMGVVRRGEPRWFALREALIHGEAASEQAIDRCLAHWHSQLTVFAEQHRPDLADPEQWATDLLQPPARDSRGALPIARPAQAVVLLCYLGLQASPDAIAELAPMMTERYGTRRFCALTAIVSRGDVPTRAAVTAEIRQDTRRAWVCQAAARTLTAGAPQQVAQFVADFVAAHGHGPTWSEMGRAHGWTRSQTRAVIRCLQRRTWLTFTEAERSLRPGSAYQAMPATGEPPAHRQP